MSESDKSAGAGGIGAWQPIETAPKVPNEIIFGWVEQIDSRRRIVSCRHEIYWRKDEKDEATFSGGQWYVRTNGSWSDDYAIEGPSSRVAYWLILPEVPPRREAHQP